MRSLFRIPADAKLPVEPIRVANITKEEFREFALRGQPVIITDGMRDWPGASKWNCQYFRDAFPNEEVGGFTAFKADAMKFQRKLGDPWFNEVTALNIPRDEQDPKNPHIMSWYFSGIGVSGTRGREIERNATVTEMLRADYKVCEILRAERKFPLSHHNKSSLTF